jgi:hypothetical protein
MARKPKLKINDTVSFLFAGTTERGKIIKIEGEGKNLRYTINDGKYSYPITEEAIQK